MCGENGPHGDILTVHTHKHYQGYLSLNEDKMSNFINAASVKCAHGREKNQE